jgi:gamma-tubulin complex component 3
VLEYSHGELGWDCFALEYKVEAPLNAVLDAKAMAEYDRLFHHLWRLKRVESALTQGWMRVTSGSRMFEKLPSEHNFGPSLPLPCRPERGLVSPVS